MVDEFQCSICYENKSNDKIHFECRNNHKICELCRLSLQSHVNCGGNDGLLKCPQCRNEGMKLQNLPRYDGNRCAEHQFLCISTIRKTNNEIVSNSIKKIFQLVNLKEFFKRNKNFRYKKQEEYDVVYCGRMDETVIMLSLNRKKKEKLFIKLRQSPLHFDEEAIRLQSAANIIAYDAVKKRFIRYERQIIEKDDIHNSILTNYQLIVKLPTDYHQFNYQILSKQLSEFTNLDKMMIKNHRFNHIDFSPNSQQIYFTEWIPLFYGNMMKEEEHEKFLLNLCSFGELEMCLEFKTTE
ncbi:hypothetical protein SNEBB_006024 [Seison nebaliae]|nr:hypothetical protein SNEBB_006024 [Seison nebaliae]